MLYWLFPFLAKDCIRSPVRRDGKLKPANRISLKFTFESCTDQVALFDNERTRIGTNVNRSVGPEDFPSVLRGNNLTANDTEFAIGVFDEGEVVGGGFARVNSRGFVASIRARDRPKGTCARGRAHAHTRGKQGVICKASLHNDSELTRGVCTRARGLVLRHVRGHVSESSERVGLCHVAAVGLPSPPKNPRRFCISRFSGAERYASMNV